MQMDIASGFDVNRPPLHCLGHSPGAAFQIDNAVESRTTSKAPSAVPPDCCEALHLADNADAEIAVRAPEVGPPPIVAMEASSA
jgi:hypothetical protein